MWQVHELFFFFSISIQLTLKTSGSYKFVIDLEYDSASLSVKRAQLLRG